MRFSGRDGSPSARSQLKRLAAQAMHIRALTDADASLFQAARLQGLLEEPSAFASSYEEEVITPIAEIERRLVPKADGAIFGAFDGSDVVGLIGVQRESMTKLSHKAVVWGMYVRPTSRRCGCGARLLQHALNYAWNTLRVCQVNLGVHAQNDAALQLYMAHGFIVFGTEVGALMVAGVLQDELHMVCKAPSGVTDCTEGGGKCQI